MGEVGFDVVSFGGGYNRLEKDQSFDHSLRQDTFLKKSTSELDEIRNSSTAIEAIKK